MQVNCSIYVKKQSQKGIVIGKNGSMLKKLAHQARLSMESHVKQKIFLSCRVRTVDWQTRADLLTQMKIGMEADEHARREYR